MLSSSFVRVCGAIILLEWLRLRYRSQALQFEALISPEFEHSPPYVHLECCLDPLAKTALSQPYEETSLTDTAITEQNGLKGHSAQSRVHGRSLGAPN